MSYRASPSGITLDADDAALIKGMLDRGDRQHDVAAWFGVNGGRIAEISAGHRFAEVEATGPTGLPPAGPYPRGREAYEAVLALRKAEDALIAAERALSVYVHASPIQEQTRHG